MLQVNVILDEVSEAADNFLIELRDAYFSYTFFDLFWRQCHRLLLEELIEAKANVC